jgi:hypothetical protein
MIRPKLLRCVGRMALTDRCANKVKLSGRRIEGWKSLSLKRSLRRSRTRSEPQWGTSFLVGAP